MSWKGRRSGTELGVDLAGLHVGGGRDVRRETEAAWVGGDAASEREA